MQGPPSTIGAALKLVIILQKVHAGSRKYERVATVEGRVWSGLTVKYAQDDERLLTHTWPVLCGRFRSQPLLPNGRA